jgi:hypothetical protein
MDAFVLSSFPLVFCIYRLFLPVVHLHDQTLTRSDTYTIRHYIWTLTRSDTYTIRHYIWTLTRSDTTYGHLHDQTQVIYTTYAIARTHMDVT